MIRSIRISSVLFPFLLLLSADAVRAQLRAELLGEGLQEPVAIVPDPLHPGTLIVLEQSGRARVIASGVIQATPFLDLTSVVKNEMEQGLLGLAFSPDGSRVFVQFVARRDPDLGIGDTVIARFRRSADPLVLDPASRFDLVWPGGQGIIEQPTAMHKGGNLVFGPDGYLYVGLGDGGTGGGAPGAQSPEVLLGKMLRLDVSVPDNHPTGYQIPADNPFVDGVPVPALHEIWAFGYRNPWRFSFDDFGDGATGAMIVGDVGEDALEEINYEPAGQGGRNYGWHIREGSVATPPTPNVPAFSEPAYLPLSNPMAEYPRTVGRAVTGGFVYRGSTLPSVYRGRYFVADFFGAFYSVGLATDAAGEGKVIDVMDHAAELGNPQLVTTFGRGFDGELYFASLVGGRIYKIVPDPPAPPAPPSLTISVSGSTVALSWQSGADGGPVLTYQLEAGSSPGAADLMITETTGTELVVRDVPPGQYFVRVRGSNSSRLGEPSLEIPLRIGCVGAPSVPSQLTASVESDLVSLAWNPVGEASSYLIEAGSAPTLTDLAVIPVGIASVSVPAPTGTYFVRVKAVTPCGITAASNEVEIVIP
jgi:glucose/arabinose dehydrogenase